MKKSIVAGLLALPLALSACGSGLSNAQESPGGKVPAVGEVYALAYLLEQVGGDRVHVEQLIPSGSDVHGYELSPAQVTTLSMQNVAVVISTLAAAVDEGLAANPPSATIDLAKLLPTRPAVDDGDHEDHAGGIDPHLWLDPAQMPTVVDAIAKELSAADPSGADDYAANAKSLNAKFEALDTAYRTGLGSCARDTIVITHPAFGYLAEQYGLKQVGISGVDEDTEPSPARLVDVGKAAKAAGATTIFFSSTANPKVAQVFADELGLKTATLSLITSAPDGQDYFTLAESNLASLRTGLGCS